MVETARLRPMKAEWPTGIDARSARRRIEAIEKILERSFHIPGTRIPVGLDAVAGLVPVAGDVLTAAMGLYAVWEARNLGMSKWQLARMLGNVGVDTAIGAVPILGDLFDFAYRSNTRNLKILRRHLDRHHPSSITLEG